MKSRFLPQKGCRYRYAPLLRLLLLMPAFLALATGVQAANRYWVAASAGNWNNTANWSASSGGTGGSSVPGATDRVFFDGGGPGNCNLDIPVTVTAWNMAAAYTGIISQGANTIQVSGATAFGGGTFNGGSADIILGGAFTNSGTAFTSTSGALEQGISKAFLI
jgi:hypothetical protein